MNFSWAPEHEAFRRRLVEFLDSNLPANWPQIYRHGPGSRELTEFSMEFCPKLAREGFLVPHWPREFGGQDAETWQHFILGEELWAIGEPRGGQYMNVNWIGPTVMKYGSEAQRQRYLPEMAAGQVLWCQGFSEPSAGSDLASLRTRAERRGDEYMINGQKIWTSYASLASHCFLLARTTPEGKKGISIFLISMRTPGITVRMIPSLIGDGDIHEVFFDNVVVPASSVLGEPGRAWEIITYALANERVGIARYEFSRRALDRMVATLQSLGRFRSSAVRESAGRALAACEAARLLVYKIVDQRARGRAPTPESSLARWAVVVADHAVTNFALEYLPESFSDETGLSVLAHHERAIAAGIAAGAAEIQLNTIAYHHLNLPREARA
jgi:alkylation response protein AidB-like acyl-CoA dehydrogenase